MSYWWELKSCVWSTDLMSHGRVDKSTYEIAIVVMSYVWGVESYVLDSNSPFTWWRHQMETFSALLAICAGNSPVTGEFPAHRPVTRSFDVFFDHEAGDLRRHRAHYDVIVMYLTDKLASPPYKKAIIAISYGRVNKSSISDSMMFKNTGWPSYVAIDILWWHYNGRHLLELICISRFLVSLVW